MNILQICNKPPFPAVDGGAIAMNNTTQGLLNNGHKVTVLAITTPKHPVIYENLPEEYIKKTNFQTVFIDTSIRLRDAFFNLFTTSAGWKIYGVFPSFLNLPSCNLYAYFFALSTRSIFFFIIVYNYYAYL